jgi:hypothetical protein
MSIQAASGTRSAHADRYENLALTRAEDGVFAVRFHTARRDRVHRPDLTYKDQA